MAKSCRTCKFYVDSYGFSKGSFVGLYTSCDFKENMAIRCKKANFEKNDLMIMGNLKYFYMIEKIIGKTGAKLLEHSTIPIFIG